MEDDRDSVSMLDNGFWNAQPLWMKAVSILIGAPAWFVLMAPVFGGNVSATLENVALGALVATCLLQLAFVFRAYQRMDL